MQNYLHCSKSLAYNAWFRTDLASLQKEHHTKNSSLEKENWEVQKMLPLQKYSIQILDYN